MRKIIGFVAALTLVFAAALKADFMFWLEGPARSNANDPKSSLFFPTPTMGAVGTSTFTRTVTPSNTPVNTGTSTFTATPSATPSPSATPWRDASDPGDDILGGATAFAPALSTTLNTSSA